MKYSKNKINSLKLRKFEEKFPKMVKCAKVYKTKN